MKVSLPRSSDRLPSRKSFLRGKASLTRPLAGLVLAAGISVCDAHADTPMRTENGAGSAQNTAASGLIAIARRDLGKTGPQLGLPARLWCGYGMNRWRRAAGYSAPTSGYAFAHVQGARRVAAPVVGALLIQGRPCKRGRSCGHVSLITAVHPNGTVTAISANDGGRVRERVRSARGIIVLPH